MIAAASAPVLMLSLTRDSKTLNWLSASMSSDPTMRSSINRGSIMRPYRIVENFSFTQELHSDRSLNPRPPNLIVLSSVLAFNIPTSLMSETNWRDRAARPFSIFLLCSASSSSSAVDSSSSGILWGERVADNRLRMSSILEWSPFAVGLVLCFLDGPGFEADRLISVLI